MSAVNLVLICQMTKMDLGKVMMDYEYSQKGKRQK